MEFAVMDEQSGSIILARDELNEIAQVVSFLGAVFVSGQLDEYASGGANAVADWVTDRLRACSDGLRTMVLPAARAGASLIAVRYSGLFQGMIPATTPIGSCTV